MAKGRWWWPQRDKQNEPPQQQNEPPQQQDERRERRERRRFQDLVKSVELQIDHLTYQSVFDPITNAAAPNQLSQEQISNILSAQYLGPPHGNELLKPAPLPKLPELPAPPTRGGGAHFTRVKEKLEKLASIAAEDRERLAALASAYKQGNPKAVAFLASLALVRHYLPYPLVWPADSHYDPIARVILCNIKVPNFSTLPIVKAGKKNYELVPVSASERKKAQEAILFSLCIRAAYLIAQSDIDDRFDSVAVNAHQQWFDGATGASREGTVASLHALKQELCELQLDHIDPKLCFRHLKGVATPSTDQVIPVRPIFVMNTEDGRIVEERDVASNLAEEANLAAMPWEDFEHLVRQLFEWEFGRNGVEVKVTRASRDRGVDAIMYDPDPLRGGVFVLQAKRYTRTVDVSSVRDLYGTVVNEGANRGVLVTTSGFGPDAYEFAKGKPISLVDGPNLIAMLRRHGRRYRIDLAEARRLYENG